MEDLTHSPFTVSESLVAEHKLARTRLISAERSLRYDHQDRYVSSLRPTNEPQLLEQADSILRKLRKVESETVWSVETEQVPHIFPGMEFLTAKSTIESTKLFKYMKKLPKGALLHAHMDAMCDARFLYNEALKHPQIHIRCSGRISGAASLRSILPEFMAFPVPFTTGTIAVSISDPKYEDNAWIPLAQARKEFSQELGGTESFDRWIIKSMTIDPEEAYKEYNNSKKVWKKFQSTFLVASNLVRYEPVLKAYFRELLLSSIEDGISYIEARVMFFDRQGVRENGNQDLDHREWCQIFSACIEQVKQDMKKQGREDEFVGAKVIYCTLRSIDFSELNWYLEECIALKKEYPDLIAGFDLVGQEDGGKPLIDYLPQLLAFQERVKNEGLNIPFIFHAGETLGDGDGVDENLYDALLLGTKRIGHGFSMARHPHLMNICREKGVLLEVCPISWVKTT
ncbi:hypothetical protein FRC02_011644 [Tulasnella sp. 418]|nr:hypothetical protein FRC02_011644 [Tulasnella sp. 418]